VSLAVFTMALRLRWLTIALTMLGTALAILMVGALFPAVGGSIGKLDLPAGVADLLGGADYGTITGWMRSEVGAVYGPLVIAAIAITGAVGATAGEEERGILGLTLAYPITRSQLVLASRSSASPSARWRWRWQRRPGARPLRRAGPQRSACSPSWSMASRRWSMASAG
jgi:hypothetical protein